MRIQTYFGGTCAVSCIAGLSTHTGPVNALQDFCGQELGILSYYQKKYGTLAAYYVFVAGPEVPFDEEGGSHHSSRTWVRYGTEFAEYLTEHKLGPVVTVGPKKNMKHHPDTTAQIWLWNPSQKAVAKWWTECQKGKHVDITKRR